MYDYYFEFKRNADVLMDKMLFFEIRRDQILYCGNLYVCSSAESEKSVGILDIVPVKIIFGENSLDFANLLSKYQ